MSKKDIIKYADKSKNPADLEKIGRNIENTSNFLKLIDKDDKKLYKNMVEMLRTDTKNELTETEYESIAKMQFFCDRFEAHFSETNISEINPDLLETYRKMKTQITAFLRDYRAGTKRTPPSIILIKNVLSESEKTVKDMKFEKKTDAEIIDVEIEDGDSV